MPLWMVDVIVCNKSTGRRQKLGQEEGKSEPFSSDVTSLFSEDNKIFLGNSSLADYILILSRREEKRRDDCWLFLAAKCAVDIVIRRNQKKEKDQKEFPSFQRKRKKKRKRHVSV